MKDKHDYLYGATCPLLAKETKPIILNRQKKEIDCVNCPLIRAELCWSEITYDHRTGKNGKTIAFLKSFSEAIKDLQYLKRKIKKFYDIK